MKIDILSDLHLDFYFRAGLTITTKNVKSLFDDIFKKDTNDNMAEVLIIAGDLGHYNEQNIEVLKIIHKEYYKYIICVLGNHDYYLLNNIIKQQYDFNSFNRAKQMRDLINNEPSMYCLDGDVITINDIKFGGCDSSYNYAYIKHYFPNKDKTFINSLWKNSINDYNNMEGVNDFEAIFKIEEPKIKAVYQKCDIMITHVNPSYLEEHIHPKYHNSDINTFFTFDGHEYLKKGTMKYWVFGHTHDIIDYTFHNVDCVCSPMGYPGENDYGNLVKIKSIEINNAISIH